MTAWPADALEDFEERVAIMAESRVPDAQRKAEERVRRRWRQYPPSAQPQAPRGAPRDAPSPDRGVPA